VYQWRASLRESEIARQQLIIDANDLGAFYRFVKSVFQTVLEP